MVSLIRKINLSFLLGILSIAIVIAQDAACSELVQAALESVENNCATLGRNELCYGNTRVQASFLDAVPDDYFSKVSDIVPVANLISVQSLPMNSVNQEWGIAVMNLQANIPNSITGQNVTFILMGGGELENAVSVEDTFIPSEGIEVSLAVASANLRSGAGLNFNVVNGIGRGETIIADGISEDGEWLRVVKNEQALWLNRSLVVENPEIDSLPILTDELRTPMQSFYLRTGIGQPACVEAPDDILLVQGPEDIEIQLTINGANVKLSGTSAVRIVEVDGASSLEVLVFDGEVHIDGTTVGTGQRSLLCLGDNASLGLDGVENDLVVTCEPSIPEPIEDFGEDWCKMETIPTDILNYNIEILCPGETPLTTSTGTASVSVIREVDCRSFTILTSNIPATDFVFSWTEATGADSYEVAVYDNSGFQVSSTTTTATSLNMNGGTSFPPAGYVDLRAYLGGVYACYARLNFTRSVDPNQQLVSGLVINCSTTDGVGFDVIWSNVIPPVDISYSSGGFGPAGSDSFTSSSGTYSQSYLIVGVIFYITASTGDGKSVGSDLRIPLNEKAVRVA